MRSHKDLVQPTLSLLFGLLVVTTAFDARAQAENTAAACQDRVDNDLDGYVDCQDQDCNAIVTCAQVRGGLPLPGLLPPRPVEPTGRGMATAGLALSSTGIAFMLTGMVLGLVPEGEGSDDGRWVSMMAIGISGLIITQIGDGLLLGALGRVNRSTRALGVPSRPGTVIAGWVLWGLTLATPGIGVGLMQIEPEPPVGVTFVTPLTLGIATFATVLTGYIRNRNYYRRAAAQRQPTSFTMAPYMASTPYGTFAGVAGTF